MIVALYARVSTDTQDELNQLPSLRQMAKNYGCEVFGEYSDVASGRSRAIDRPGLAALMKDARAGHFDTIMVVKLDRIMRSLQQLLALLESLDKNNLTLITGDLGVIDLKSPVGKLQLQLVGAIAEWEAGVISERTRAALAVKKAQGVTLGRPRKNNFDIETAARLKISGHSRKEIATKLGCSVIDLNNRRRELAEKVDELKLQALEEAE